MTEYRIPFNKPSLVGNEFTYVAEAFRLLPFYSGLSEAEQSEIVAAIGADE